MKRLALLIAVAALAGCGESDPQNRRAAPAPTSDRAAARKALLTISDFPAGWEQRDVPADDQSPSENDPCPVLKSALGKATTDVETLGFEMGESRVGGGVLAYPNVEAARQAFTSFTSESTRRCVAVPRTSTGEVNDSLSGSTSVVRAPQVGDQSLTYVSRLASAGDDTAPTFDATIQTVRVGRWLLIVSGAPASNDLVQKLSATAVRRLKASGAQTD